jgi:hypothetical protein
MEQEPTIAEPIAYYRARAPEHDEWFNRRGRYVRHIAQNGSKKSTSLVHQLCTK